MLKINLVPHDVIKEYQGQNSEHKILIGSISLIVIPLSVWMYLSFYILPQQQQKLTSAIQQREQLKKVEQKHKKLNQLIGQFTQRQKAVEECQTRRTFFSHKLHQLATILQDHPVWLHGLDITPRLSKTKSTRTSKSRTKETSKLTFVWKSKGTCIADKLKTATHFHRSLQNNHQFFQKDFIDIEMPQYTSITLENNQIGWDFKLHMTMQPHSNKTKQNK